MRVVHCSTGRPGLETTPGVWNVYLKSLRFYSQEYDSWMPWTSFFHGGEGLHGYEEVPAYPASHGCVRLSMPEAPWVYGFAAMGTTVVVVLTPARWPARQTATSERPRAASTSRIRWSWASSGWSGSAWSCGPNCSMI